MKRLIRYLLFFLIIGVVSIVIARIAFPLPPSNHTEPTQRLPAEWSTELGQIVQGAIETHPERTGIRPLTHGLDAFTARALLAREAESSIDAQYYIWQDDTTGLLLLDELRAAAERGVRVRLLVDDNGIPRMDNLLAELDEMPTAEVRIFNPFTLRDPKFASYLFDFPRLNRRMHNKSITFDGFASIIGGRNIGDIYFEFGKGLHYVDVDVLAVGQVVDDVSENFDTYWNSKSVYDADFVLAKHFNEGLTIAEAAQAARETSKGSGYEKAILTSDLAAGIKARHLPFEWTEVTLFTDPPTKGLGEASDDELLANSLATLALEANESLDLVSAYFVPADQAMDVFRQLSVKGVETRVLTNSLEATDVAPVHGAYMHKRAELLDLGTRLFELRALREEHKQRSLPEILAGSASSLHAKVMSFDRTRAFVGSYNLDPRSAWLNCEMGLLIESPSLASWISQNLDTPHFAYEVKQDETKSLYWVGTAQDRSEIVLESEPNVSNLYRTLVNLSGWLPLDWML